MSAHAASLLILLAGIYLATGVLFAIPFVLVGAGRIDHHAKDATWGFRVVILPGVVVLWPLLAARLLPGADRPIVERNAHRAAAQRHGTAAGKGGR